MSAQAGQPRELEGAMLRTNRCQAKRSEGISIDALETGTGPHVDETDVDAKWERERW